MTSSAEHTIDLNEESRRFHSFVNLALFMAAITGIELVIIFVPFNNVVIVVAIVGLSAAKFIGVILWFMHLIYDRFLSTVLFLMGLILAIGTVTALLVLFDAEDSALPNKDSAWIQRPGPSPHI